jgi:hypothetical protein
MLVSDRRDRIKLFGKRNYESDKEEENEKD